MFVNLNRTPPAKARSAAPEATPDILKKLLKQAGQKATPSTVSLLAIASKSGSKPKPSPAWVPPRGEMKVTYMNQTYLVTWVRGKPGRDGWSITGHWTPLVNGKPRSAGKMVLSTGSKIQADGRLLVKMASFNNVSIVSRLSVFQTASGKFYKRFHDLYTSIRQEASNPKSFALVGKKRLDATSSTVKLADFIRDYGALKIADGGDALSGWLRKHIVALTKSRAYGKAKGAKQMARAVATAARAAGFETADLRQTFDSIVQAIRSESKKAFKELKRYETKKDPKTGKTVKVLVKTGYTKGTLRLAAFLAEIGSVNLKKMAQAPGGLNVFGELNKLMDLKDIGGYVRQAARVAGLSVGRRSLIPDLSAQGGFMTLAQLLVEANNVLPNNVANGMEVAAYNLWARTGRRVLTHDEAVAAADAWQTNFNQNVRATIDQLCTFLRQPGALARRGMDDRRVDGLRHLLTMYLTPRQGTDDRAFAYRELLRFGHEYYGLTRSPYVRGRLGNTTLVDIINTILFGDRRWGDATQGRRDFIQQLDDTRRRNAEAALLVARAAPAGTWAEMLQILLGFGIFTVQHGKGRNP